MKHRFWVTLLAAVGLGVVMYAVGSLGDRESSGSRTAQGAEEEVKAKKKPSGLPPLVVDKSAPLLLDEPAEEDPWAVPKGPVADNQACYVCHTNYEEEEFAKVHAEANVGCVKCHGESIAHRNDEDNITPPDNMYWPEKIESNCQECHEEHDVPAVEVIVRWQERCPTKTNPKEIVCTDCHGKHRLENRTVWWDKKTGELVLPGKDQPKKNDPDVSRETNAPAKRPGQTPKPSIEK